MAVVVVRCFCFIFLFVSIVCVFALSLCVDDHVCFRFLNFLSPDVRYVCFCYC